MGGSALSYQKQMRGRSLITEVHNKGVTKRYPMSPLVNFSHVRDRLLATELAMTFVFFTDFKQKR